MDLTSFLIFWLLAMAILAGLGLLLQAGTRADIQKRQALPGWPKTSGTVTGARLEKKGSVYLLFSMLEFYLPVIEYTYQVGGTDFQSASYKNAWSPFNRSAKWRTIYPKKAARVIEAYASGKTVDVTFNPDNPSEAYLEVDAVTVSSWTWRVSGLALILAAGLLFVRGAVLVVSDRTSQARIDSLPAAVPVTSQALQSGLQGSLGLTCQSNPSHFAGEALTYLVWKCDNPSDSAAPIVWIYGRQRSPDKVDYVSAVPGGTAGMEKREASLAGVARLAAPQMAAQAIEDWVFSSMPDMLNEGDEANTTLGGVSFSLAADVTDYFKSVKLKIGGLR